MSMFDIGAGLSILSKQSLPDRVRLSSLDIDNTAPAGTAIGTLSVSSFSPGPWTFSLTSPSDNSLAISGNQLVVGSAGLPQGAAAKIDATVIATNGSKTVTGKFKVNSRALSGFTAIKAKLAAGQDAVLFISGDSTSHSDYGPYLKLAQMIGNLHNATVRVYRWAEWVLTAATGPKAYAAPNTIRIGAGGPTLTIYLASLPGAVAGAMFDGSRRPAAIDAIPTPDACILHHGHNMQSFEAPGNIYAAGRGIFFGALGMTEMKWPGVPQIMTSQNPWRTTGYDKVYQAELDVAAAHPGLTFIDTHASMIAAGKIDRLYRKVSATAYDNIHPSDLDTNSEGAQLIAEKLFDAYKSAAAVGAPTTPAWPLGAATNLLANGDFSNWTGALPVGFSGPAPLTISKDTVNKYGSAAYCVSILPNGTTAAAMGFLISNADLAAMVGKTVSLMILAKAPAGNNFYASWVVKSGGTTRTFNLTGLYGARDGWMWYGVTGVPVDTGLTNGQSYINILPNFFSAAGNNNPLFVQKIMMVEGVAPKGGLV